MARRSKLPGHFAPYSARSIRTNPFTSLRTALAVLLRVDKEDMMQRNAKRLFCLGIQPGFAVVTAEDNQRCLAAGGQVGVRPDDAQEKFTTRWQQFETRTSPVIEKYRQEGILREVDGRPTIANVQTAVMNVISRHGQQQTENS